MKKPRLVSIGDLMLDVVVRADAALESGTDVRGTVRFRLGGSAGNTCRAFVKLGGAASLVAAVGADGLGRRLTAAMRATGVSVHAVRAAGATPRLLALIDADGERSFVTERGAADALRAADVRASWLASADVLHLPAYSLLAAPVSDASAFAASSMRANGRLVSVDLASRGPLLATGVDAGLRAVSAAAPHVLFANASEVDAVVGRRSARRLLDLAPLVVVKMGASGCQVLWRASPTSREVVQFDVATKPVTAADTTGAGDAFDAGFLFALTSASTAAGAAFPPTPALYRRAAMAGHRAAASLLTARRPELSL